LTGTAWLVSAMALPLVGLLALLLHSKVDPGWTNPQLHFVLFLSVAALDFVLAAIASAAARRRGDARVLLIALAFFSFGGFLGLHAIGTPEILFDTDHAGFKVAIPVGLIVAAVFAVGSAFVDLRPRFAPAVIERQALLQNVVIVVMVFWFAITVADVPPLDRPSGEGAKGSTLAILAGCVTAVYAVAAVRYWAIFRREPGLLAASVIACFVLLAEAMIGVATTGERSWHASWWLWHALIVMAFVIVGLAARREWRDERFRPLYLDTTRERSNDVTALFCDLAGFTSYSERSPPAEVAAMLKAYFELAAPIIARFGGDIEHFTGDGIVSTFNTRGDQRDHAVQAARAALALQQAMAARAIAHPEWPGMRVGVNTGPAVIREMGGDGHVAWTAVGDSVNVGARLEAAAPVGGVLVGAETFRRLPDGAVGEQVAPLQVKGKDELVEAFVLKSLG
jgi:class 3 adenylate cyclase